MTDLKILLTDGLNENGQAILRASGQVDDRPDITAEDLLKVAGEYDAMIVRGRTKVTAAVFEAAARLKVVGRAGVGVDNIDLEAAKAHGVTVVNAPRLDFASGGGIDPGADAVSGAFGAACRRSHESRAVDQKTAGGS